MLIRGPRYSLLTRRRVTGEPAPAASVTYLDEVEDENDLTTYTFPITVAANTLIGLAARGGNSATISSVKVHQPDVSTEPTGVTATSRHQLLYGTSNLNRLALFSAVGLASGAAEIVVVYSAGRQRAHCFTWQADNFLSFVPTATASDGALSGEELAASCAVQAGGVLIGLSYAPFTGTQLWSGLTERIELGTLSSAADMASAGGETVNATVTYSAAVANAGMILAAFR